MTQAYDIVIIGAGAAGITAARFAAQLGRKVALVEKHRVGGDCTWAGCVPSKTLLKVAKVAHDMRHADRYGVGPVEPVIDLKTVMGHVSSVVDQVYQPESPEALQAEGIDVHLGPARFVDSHTIAVGDTLLKARRVIIATGAESFVPPIEGLDTINYLTYETIWGLEDLHERLLVIGGGSMGCEFAQAFCRLGARVTVLERGQRILDHDEPEASDLVAKCLEQDGVEVRLNSAVERVWQVGGKVHMMVSGQELAGDALLLAVGRHPTMADLDLEKAGVNYTNRGIVVNNHLRTSQRHIYASGDCAGGYQFTHYAGFQGFMAVRNALLPGSVRAVLDRVPWCTFTDPEVAHAGMTEAQARQRFGDSVMVCSLPMNRVDRALTEGDAAGFIKIVHQPNGAILGVTIVNARAGEMVHEWILAMDQGLKISDLVSSIHVYPTYSMASQQVALQVRMGQLLTGVSGRIIRGLLRLTQ